MYLPASSLVGAGAEAAVDGVKFISKKEREAMQANQELMKEAERKKVEAENKQRKRDLLKSSTANVVAKDAGVASSSSILSPEELQLIRERHLGSEVKPTATAEGTGGKRERAKRDIFEYDYEREDTSTLDTYNTSGTGEVGGRVDPLAVYDRKRGVSSDRVRWDQKLLSEMTERDWKIFTEDMKILVSGKDVPHPFRSWSESGLPREVLDAVYKAGYTRPTPIQMQAIPLAMAKRDIVGISSTGSGKTAAFILPMLFYIREKPAITLATAGDGPYGLVLAPSRELAQQIEQEAMKFASFCKVRVFSIVGGRSSEQQTMTLSQGVELIVATPGRLADSLDGNQTVLNQCFYVVLDEADRMVDLGFEPFLNRILDAIPEQRITQMFSATMPVQVERLTRKYLINPVTVTTGDIDTGLSKPEILQSVEFTQTESDKKRKLFELLNAEETEYPIIVFVSSKRNGDMVGTLLDNAGYRVMVLHSGKVQLKREDALAQFRKGTVDILVATDVAGRGLDIPDVKHVVNFDMPRTIEDYTHRIGRTGRAGKAGSATSFVTPYDEEILPDLKKFLVASKQFIPEELEKVVMERNEDIGSAKRQNRSAATVFAI